MTKRFKTVEEALKHFLRSAPRKSGGKETVRRYEVAGSICKLSRTNGPRGRHPRFQWIEPAPDQYFGVDITLYFRYGYLAPYAEPKYTPPEKPVPRPAPPIPMEFGCAVHKTDERHYKALLKRLKQKDIEL